jgi:hypothetical protein
MKKILLYLVVLVMLVTNINAQKGGAAFFKTGYLYAPGSAKIFNAIDGGSNTGFTNNYMIVGLELYYRTGKAILSWEGYTAQQVSSTIGGSPNAEPFLGASQLRFGWVVNDKKRSVVYPSIGLGSAATILATYPRNNEKNFKTSNQFLLTPSIDIGINKDIFIDKIVPGSKKYGGMIVGLRAGYRTSVNSNNWRNDNWDKLYNMPSYSNNCFYLSVNIGAGSFSSKK